MAPSPYKNSKGYEWYSSHTQRPEGLPAYEYNEKQEIILSPGELFCRFGQPGMPGIRCPITSRFSRMSNLRRHIMKHTGTGVVVRTRGTAANSVLFNMEIATFYHNLMDNAVKSPTDGCVDNDDEDEDDDDEERPPATPREPTPPQLEEKGKAKATLLELPLTRRGLYVKSKMRANGGFRKTGRCDGCYAINRKNCPPLRRPKEGERNCEVWDKFEVNVPAELATIEEYLAKAEKAEAGR
ncbi:hypothetical protein B0T24DRAFT_670411 [Lasiosphaeria ovina]|uniref:C2H2-type domain-containing protein n=1 Tax=Lasiosphaeria ovina TaxID=92902 RepID=A0AAE0MZL0_9PEZI|nr:hypothetical protein B0T24DRAFT_670411 [Lasiosphaeria ovina]